LEQRPNRQTSFIRDIFEKTYLDAVGLLDSEHFAILLGGAYADGHVGSSKQGYSDRVRVLGVVYQSKRRKCQTESIDISNRFIDITSQHTRPTQAAANKQKPTVSFFLLNKRAFQTPTLAHARHSGQIRSPASAMITLFLRT